MKPWRDNTIEYPSEDEDDESSHEEEGTNI